MLSTTRLRVFAEVAARGSFSAAADALSYTQSAVSQQIAALEGEVGTQLVERRPRGVRLTPAGKVLLEHADAVLTRLEFAATELSELAGLRSGRLALASFPSAGATLAPRAIAAFRAKHPDVELTLAESEPEVIAPRLEVGDFDLALLFEFDGVPLEADGLRRVPLLEEEMRAVLPPEHRLVKRTHLQLADLADEAWVQTSVDSACAQHVVRCCRGAGFEPRVAFESDDYQTVQGLVAAGVGVALIPQLALSGARENVVVRALARDAPKRDVFAAVRRGTRTPAAEAMLTELRAAAAEDDFL